MKNLLRLLSVSFCILIGMKPIHAQWTQTALKQGAVVEMIVSDDKLIAGDWGGGVFISYNGGTSWAEVGNWHFQVWAIEVDGSNIFAGTAGGGVYLHKEDNPNWISVNEGLPIFSYVTSLTISGEYLLAGIGWGVWFSADSGKTWSERRDGLPNTEVNSLFTYGTKVFAGTQNGIYYTTNNGSSWINVCVTKSGVTDFTTARASGGTRTNIYASTNGEGIFLSTNNGLSWETVNNGLSSSDVYYTHPGCDTLDIYSLAASDTNVFAGTEEGGIFFTNNNGLSWKPVNSGLGKQSWDSLYNAINSLVVSGEYLLAAGGGVGVLKRPLAEMITNVGNEQNNIEKNFTLKQNYPNPFNPVTTITYILPYESKVRIVVYNLIGEVVKELVSENILSGYHEVRFDATKLTSGVYFYSLNATSIDGAKNYQSVKKMILLK